MSDLVTPDFWAGRFTAVASADFSFPDAQFNNGCYFPDLVFRSGSGTDPEPVTLTRGIAETVLLADTASRAAMARARAVAETVLLADAAARSPLVHVRAVAQPLVLADTAARSAMARARAVVDTVLLADVPTQVRDGVARAVAEVISLSSVPRLTVRFARQVTGGTVVLLDVATAGGTVPAPELVAHEHYVEMTQPVGYVEFSWGPGTVQ